MTLVTLLSLAGCSLKVFDKPAAQGPVKLVGAETSCLDRALSTVQGFKSGQVSEAEIDESATCLVSALDKFVANARGRSADHFTPAELRAFSETYFLGTTKISDELLKELMVLKQQVVGGEADQITRSELQRSREILLLLKAEAQRLLPYIRIITRDLEPSELKANAQQVERAIEELNRSLKVIGGLFGRSSKAYDLKNFETLLGEIQKLYDKKSLWDGPKWVIDRLSTVRALKAALIRPEGHLIQSAEWSDVFAVGGRLYSSYLRWYYLAQGQPLLKGEGLAQLARLLPELFVLLDEAVKAKRTGVIEYKEIDAVLDELVRIEVLKLPVPLKTVKAAVRTACEKILNAPVGRMRVRVAKGGVTASVLARLRTEVLGWLEMQKLWAQLVTRAVKKNPRLAGQPLPLETVQTLWSKVAVDAGLSSAYLSSFDDLNFVFQRQQPLTTTSDEVVVFERETKFHFVDQDTFNALNWKTHAVRAAILGYSKDPDENRYRGLVKEEFKALFTDFRQLLVEFKFIEPGDSELWDTLFDELNMFSLSADGDKKLSYDEGLDFVAAAMSSSTLWHGVYKDLLAQCRHHELDVFGFPKVERFCFHERFEAAFSGNFKRLPGWVSVAKRISKDGDWPDFINELESAVLKKGTALGPLVDSNEVSRMTMLMQYIESVFTRFDTDKSGELNLEEATPAFPLLRDVLTEASGFTEHQDLFALYVYLLRYGKPPVANIRGGLKWIPWRNEAVPWVIEADRRTLLEIVGNLNSARK
jgi:hypothetical protein